MCQRKRIELSVLIAVYAIAISALVFSGGQDLVLFEKTMVTLFHAVGMAFIGVLYLRYHSMLPAWFKDIFVFWRTYHQMPGHKAFTKYAKADQRIDEKQLEHLYGPLPTKSEDQNELWCCMLTECQTDPSVVDAHQKFFRLRDLSVAVQLLMIPIAVTYVLHFTQYRIVLDQTLFGVIIYSVVALHLLLSFCARYFAVLMVKNVLAVVSSPPLKR